jgi:hypothetical protein
VHQYNYPSQSGNKLAKATKEKIEEHKKGQLKCWSCGEENLLRDCLHMQNDHRIIYNVQEATTVNDVARNVPQIYVVENRQENHQALVVELEGILSKVPI